MPNVKYLIVMLISLSVTGCSYLSTSSVVPNRNKEYLAAKSIPPLQIPPGISSAAFHNEYPVSDRNFPGNRNVNLTPPGL